MVTGQISLSPPFGGKGRLKPFFPEPRVATPAGRRRRSGGKGARGLSLLLSFTPPLERGVKRCGRPAERAAQRTLAPGRRCGMTGRAERARGNGAIFPGGAEHRASWVGEDRPSACAVCTAMDRPRTRALDAFAALPDRRCPRACRRRSFLACAAEAIRPAGTFVKAPLPAEPAPFMPAAAGSGQAPGSRAAGDSGQKQQLDLFAKNQQIPSAFVLAGRTPLCRTIPKSRGAPFALQLQ